MNIIPPTLLVHARTMSAFLLAPAAQFGGVIVITHSFTQKDVAMFFVLTSISLFLVEFVSLGYAECHIKENAYNKADAALGIRGLLVRTIQTAPFIALLASLLAIFTITDYSIYILYLYFLLDLTGLRFVSSVESLYVANGKTKSADAVRFFGSILRLAGVITAALVFAKSGGIIIAISSAIGSSIAGIGAVIIYISKYGMIGEGPLCSVRTSIGFSLNQAARSAQQNLDRYILSMIADPAFIAVYSVSSRITMVGLIPIQALMRNYYRNYFVYGKRSARAALAYTRNKAKIVMLVALISSLGIGSASPLLPYVLGPGYQNAGLMLLLLSPLPIFWSVYYLLANVMSGINKQGLRSIILIAGTLVQIVVMLAIVPYQPYWGVGLAQFISLTLASALTYFSIREIAKPAN